ncbi:hypothetical protein Hamer_G028020, partial [Homarus americanus]
MANQRSVNKIINQSQEEEKSAESNANKKRQNFSETEVYAIVWRPQIENTYTAIEEAVLQLLDPASIHGIPGILESEELIDGNSLNILFQPS